MTTSTGTSSASLRPVIVCTQHRGVFFGWTLDSTQRTVHLQRAKMAIYWGTERGVMQLAATGPTAKSKVSAPCDMEARDVTAVFEVTPEAASKWDAA